MGTRSSDAADAANPSYHHGDLRRVLLEAAHAILAETGQWDFSLREVARRAGVSHNAPYRHFADKNALLAAIGASGFDRLNAGSAGVAADIADPATMLRTLGSAYIRFGMANPALYRLMFGQGLPNADGLPPDLASAIDTARRRLRDVIVWGGRAGAFTVDPDDADDVRAAVLAAWSLVHGFTLLTIDRVVEREVGDMPTDELIAPFIARFMAGLLHPAD